MHVGGPLDRLWCFSRLALLVGVLRGGAHLDLPGSRRHALRRVCDALAVDSSWTVLLTVSGASAGSHPLWVFSVVVHILAFWLVL